MDKNKLNLPKHSPSENLWSAIENRLNNQDSIDQLPQHMPSEVVWNRIEKATQEKRIIRPRFVLNIAASIILIVGVGYLISLLHSIRQSKSEVTISYSEVWIEPMDVESWNLEADRTVEGLIEQKEVENPMLLESKEYQFLKNEYYKLLDSKLMILNEFNPYNENVELELILTRIELQKNSIVRSLMTFNAV